MLLFRNNVILMPTLMVGRSTNCSNLREPPSICHNPSVRSILQSHKKVPLTFFHDMFAYEIYDNAGKDDSNCDTDRPDSVV